MILVALPNDDNLVAPADACPGCRQRDADLLVWLDDDRVRCQTCGRVYEPGKEADRG